MGYYTTFQLEIIEGETQTLFMNKLLLIQQITIMYLMLILNGMILRKIQLIGF